MIYIDDNYPEGVLEASFPYRDVTIKWGVDANGIFEIIDEIGRGKFGTVFKCKEKSTGLRFAAKFVPIPKREDRRNVEREVELMNSLQHHLIIQLYAAFEYQKMMCVVQELVEGGELFDRVIDDEFVLTERVCTVFIRQVCEAMQFIHRNNILHLDLKPENILCLTKEGNRIKIIDFGLARKYDPNKKLQILFGTPEFVAPEVVNFDCISYGTDMWSVGVICYVLLSGLSPFMGETDISTMANVTIAKYDFDDEAFNNVSASAMDFITKLLLKDSSSRMTATECLNHKWLKRKPKLKTTPPSPVPLAKNMPLNDEAKELEQTKNNLKVFIERWEEHPNSPYAFDIENNVIDTPKITKADSMSSSRVYSPSPCESIGSIMDPNENTKDNSFLSISEQKHHNQYHNNKLENQQQQWIYKQQQNYNDYNNENDKQQPDDDHDDNRNFKDYLQSFDRRKSDTNCFLGRPSNERMNLAEEIRKLSDHLLMLAQINTKLVKSNSNDDNNDIDNNITNETTITPKVPQHSLNKDNNDSNTILMNDQNNNINKENYIHLEKSQVRDDLKETLSEETSTERTKPHKNKNKLEKVKGKKRINESTKKDEKQNMELSNKLTSQSISVKNDPQIDDSETVEVTLSLPSSAHNTTKSITNSSDGTFVRNKISKQNKFIKATSFDNYIPFSTTASSSPPSLPLLKSSMDTTRVSKLTLRLQKSLENESFMQNGKCDNSVDDNHVEHVTFKLKNKSGSKTIKTKKSTLNDKTTATIFNGLNKSEQNESSYTNDILQKVSPESCTSLLKLSPPSIRKYSLTTSTTSISTASPPSTESQLNTTTDLINNSTSNDVFKISVPWTVTKNKRTKFRISQTSRDVPLGSPNTHQTYNLEQAATKTKDCLLHLLEKYNDNKLRTNSGSRHQSISVDWNVTDNLEYRSMNSINTFFQRHALNGEKVKKLQEQLESKSK